MVGGVEDSIVSSSINSAVSSTLERPEKHGGLPSMGCGVVEVGVGVEEVGVVVRVGEPGRVGGGELVTRDNQYWRVEERLSRMC